MEFVKNYRDNKNLRQSFNALSLDVFGIDFESWYNAGFWNENYINYSFKQGQDIISNVSINKMDLLIDGNQKRAIQIGTVMTLEEQRNKGLAYKLLNKVIEDFENEYDFLYMFANDSALSLYLNCGFKPIYEKSFSMDFKLNNDIKLKKLDMDNNKDRDLIIDFAKNNVFKNDVFSVKNNHHLIMFYSLFLFRDNIYYIKDLDVIVYYNIIDDKLKLIDVLSKKKVDLMDVINSLSGKNINKIEFMFTPNLDLNILNIEKLKTEDSTLLIRPLNNLTTNFRFPAMSQA